MLFLSASAFALTPSSDPSTGTYDSATGTYTETDTFVLNGDNPFTSVSFLATDMVVETRSRYIELYWTWTYTVDPVVKVTTPIDGYRLFPSNADNGVVTAYYSLPTWDSIEDVGEWTIQTFWRLQGTGTWQTTEGPLSFQVVNSPEPISSTLFLLGGTALAFIRRKK